MTTIFSTVRNSKLWSNCPIYILIFFFIAITGIKILISGLVLSPQIFEDELAYDLFAKQIYNGALLASHLPYPPGPFSPGYSFFIGLAYLLSPDKYAVYHYMLMINAILTSTILFPVYYLLKSTTTQKIAVLGAVIIALMPAVFMNTFVLMSEAIFIPLTLFSIWFVQRSLSSPNPGVWDILTGLSIFLLFFTRATGVSMVLGLLITVIWMVKTRAFQVNRPVIIKLFCLAIPGIVLYGAWTADQLIMKGGMPEGYSVIHYITLLTDAVILNPGHLIYVIFMHLDYILLGSFVILPLLAFRTGYPYLRDVFQNSSKEKEGTESTDHGNKNTPVLLYSITSAILLFFFGIAHMCNLSYEFPICGRYMDAILPIVVIGGIIGLSRVISGGEVGNFLKSSLVYLILIVILTSTIMFPFAHQPNNNVAIFYLYSLISEKLLPIISLFFGIVLVVLISGAIALKKGMLPLMVVLTLLAAFSVVPIYLWEIQTSAKTGSLLPFCQEVNQLSSGSAKVLWDTSSETDEWDRVVYYTLKFWLGDRVAELDQNTKNSKSSQYEITKTNKGEPVLISGVYRVIPFSASGT